ncbi:serpin family protein [uncultured Sunxiuqinia sp.]|uniref:serpin family protein n=1 Tax=uncultured Sunxiuqinia sp. TaxID=1573825 RepID=UPI00263987C6|nr:serpin family protein [uncultured Sunxiuqinia sp.]
MKTLSLFLSIALLGLSPQSCTNTPVEDGPGDTIELTKKSQQLIEGDNTFGLELFKTVNASLEEDKNLMLSPLSISLALAMTYNGAEGNTKSQMEEALHKAVFSTQEINNAYQQLVAALKSHDSKVDLSIANAIFHRDDFQVNSNFISTNQEYYQAEVEALNFNAAEASKKQVNEWVNDQTRNKIEKIIDSISPNDVMYLLNAIYFNGEWTYRFNKDQTENRTFYTENGNELQVLSMMLEEMPLNYASTEQFELLELPYGKEKYSMLIFLPNKNHSTNEVIAGLGSAGLNELLGNLHQRNLKVYLSKFEFAFETSLTDPLKTLGMTDAFSPMLADFSGISNRSDLFLSEVKHKSYIKVDEKGTEAAAVTSVTVGVTSIGAEPVFNVNRPFVFAIREKDTNTLLFLGKVNNPLRHE